MPLNPKFDLVCLPSWYKSREIKIKMQQHLPEKWRYHGGLYLCLFYSISTLLTDMIKCCLDCLVFLGGIGGALSRFSASRPHLQRSSEPPIPGYPFLSLFSPRRNALTQPNKPPTQPGHLFPIKWMYANFERTWLDVVLSLYHSEKFEKGLQMVLS